MQRLINIEKNVAIRGSLRKAQLLATLWLLATSDSYRSVGIKFDLAKSSLNHCVRRVVRALNLIASQVISWPREDHLLSTKAKFQKISKLTNVVGAIDGTHIEIPAPEVDSEFYNTRKCRYAIVLQAVCDIDLRFIDCFTGYPVSVGDLRVFRNSDLWHAVNRNRNNFFPHEEYIIGDKAYPILGWCLPPYKDNGHLTRAQQRFNQCLIKGRQVIERAFSLLKGRFRCLKYLHMSRIGYLRYKT
ncbi:protein ANTAGONIST OF LIKE HETEROCHROMATIN PROTEIN 1-like [Harpegnathos saltator]|uniref:protein ANTAGONIST OF LIKE HETEROCHROMATIN PROTEIN 1-like n=1 Tax=Harpegnathos saltator TaxID=610380 RepID=UPI000DBEE77C|nr:protein ANTAGONIST OF LIKE HETEROCHROMATIN PROTEIN 1-like [Harpegnathos saltator]